MSLVAHRFGRVKFWIFVIAYLLKQAQLKKSNKYSTRPTRWATRDIINLDTFKNLVPQTLGGGSICKYVFNYVFPWFLGFLDTSGRGCGLPIAKFSAFGPIQDGKFAPRISQKQSGTKNVSLEPARQTRLVFSIELSSTPTRWRWWNSTATSIQISPVRIFAARYSFILFFFSILLLFWAQKAVVG